MAEIVISLERGPDDQPAGQVRRACGRVATFTGWLALIRLLEDEMRELPRHAGAAGPAEGWQRPAP